MTRPRDGLLLQYRIEAISAGLPWHRVVCLIDGAALPSLTIYSRPEAEQYVHGVLAARGHTPAWREARAGGLETQPVEVES